MLHDYKLRSVNTKFWDDIYVISLDPIEKLIFLYFLTNPLTNLAGIYEISTKRIASDTGIDRDMISKILERFEKDGKIYYKNNYIILANFYKNQNYNQSMLKNAEKFVKQLPNELLLFIQKLDEQPVYTLLTACGQEEEEKEDEKEKEDEEEDESKSNPLQPLFAIWGTVPDLGESMEVQNLLKQYEFERVKRAFHIASQRKIKTVSYVRGILTNPEKSKTSKREERKIGG